MLVRQLRVSRALTVLALAIIHGGSGQTLADDRFESATAAVAASKAAFDDAQWKHRQYLDRLVDLENEKAIIQKHLSRAKAAGDEKAAALLKRDIENIDHQIHEEDPYNEKGEDAEGRQPGLKTKLEDLRRQMAVNKIAWDNNVRALRAVESQASGQQQGFRAPDGKVYPLHHKMADGMNPGTEVKYYDAGNGQFWRVDGAGKVFTMNQSGDLGVVGKNGTSAIGFVDSGGNVQVTQPRAGLGWANTAGSQIVSPTELARAAPGVRAPSAAGGSAYTHVPIGVPHQPLTVGQVYSVGNLPGLWRYQADGSWVRQQ